jgi:hypothetical protein
VTELGFIGIGQQSGAVGPGVSLTRIPRYPSSSQFAALKHFGPKLKTLALPVTDYSGADPVSKTNPPSLKLTVDAKDFKTTQLHCFFNGEAIPLKWLNDSTFVAKATETQPQQVQLHCTEFNEKRVFLLVLPALGLYSIKTCFTE